MPDKLPDEVTAQVRMVWGEHTDWTGVRVHGEVKRLNGGEERIGVRKVQQIIVEAKRPSSGATFKPFTPVEWRPWRNKRGSPETNSFLLTMDAVCRVVEGRPLFYHEARWGMRLRTALEDLMPYDQFCFVAIYAQRERVAFHLNEPEVETADLDAILAYKPWRPESAHAYGMAMRGDLAPMPLPRSRAELSVKDASDNFSNGKAWETLRVDLRPPWYISPPQQAQEPHFTGEWALRAINTALQFWMGDSPIFEKPSLHGLFGIFELDKPDLEVQQAIDTKEEANS